MDETEEPIMEDEDIKILPSVRRLIHTKLAQFCTETRGSDMYHFMQAFEILRSKVGEKPLQEHYGGSYPQLNHILRILNIRLNKLKLYYDSVKSFDDRMKEQKIRNIFEKRFAEVPLVSKALFKSFEILLEKTEIRFMPIPRECFKGVEREKKFLLDSGGSTGDTSKTGV